MALSYQEGGKGRSLNQFLEVSGRITRRPSSHTDRADALGLEQRRHPLRGRRSTIGGYPQGSELVFIGGENTRIKLPQPRPEIPESLQIAEQLEAVEETIVVDFSSGPDEAVRRPDAFEKSFAPPAAMEEAVDSLSKYPEMSVHHQRALRLTSAFEGRKVHGEIVAVPRVKHGSNNDDKPGRRDLKTDDEWEAHERHRKKAMREAAAIDILNESFGPDYAEREDSQPEISGEGKVVWSSDWLNGAPFEDEAVDYDPYLVEESRRVAGEAVVTEDPAFVDSDFVSFKELQEQEADMDPQGFFDYGITARDLREFNA